MKKVWIIIISILIVAVIVMGVVIFMLVNDKNKQEGEEENNTNTSQNNNNTLADVKNVQDAIKRLPNDKAVNYIWETLDGYWIGPDNLFISFEIKDNLPNIMYGFFKSGYMEAGRLTKSEAVGEYEAALTILIPATEATELSDATLEKNATIYIDLSSIEKDGKIKIKMEHHNDGNWGQYTFGGKTFEEAYSKFQEKR